jgi:prephenate dehydrogenase
MRHDRAVPKEIGVVGGRGKMGRLLTRLLDDAGYRVKVADLPDAPVSRAFVQQCDLIWLAVPYRRLEALLKRIGPWTRPNQTVVDICSLKADPIRWMLACCHGEVIGCHPLFGPSVEGLNDQVIFLCPGRAGRLLNWCGRFFRDRGARVVEVSPVQHDDLTAYVQAFRQLLLFCFGRTLMAEQFDLSARLDVSGPWFGGLVEMLGHQLKQDPRLYTELAIDNPRAVQVFETFRQNVEETCRILREGDHRALVDRMKEVAGYLEITADAASAPPSDHCDKRWH